MKEKLTIEERTKIVALYESGSGARIISRELNRSISTIKSFLKKFKSTKSIFDKQRSGRLQKTSKREDQVIQIAALKNRQASSNEIKANLAANYDLILSRKTIDRRLQEQGIASYVIKKKPLISKKKEPID